MTVTPAEHPVQPRTVLPAVLLGATLGLLLALLALPFVFHHVDGAVRRQLTRAFLGRRDTINVSQPTVIASIQRLARLESVIYTMDKVVEGDRTNQYFPDFLTGDRLLLVVHGQAVAGVDLSRIQPANVEIDGKSVTISLPPAELLSVSLDNAKTRVFSRTTGLLVPADPDLETEVREKAEADLRQSALDSGILNSANANTRATLATLLRSLGFEQITFR
jgi:Protein of unknown function (DUF4230)